MASGIARRMYYTTCNKHLAPEKSPTTREYTFSVHRPCGRIVDAPVHVATSVFSDHAQMEDYNDGTNIACTTNYGFIYVDCKLCVKCRLREVFQ